MPLHFTHERVERHAAGEDYIAKAWAEDWLTLEGLLRRWLVGLQERISPADILALIAATRAAVPDAPMTMPNLREALDEWRSQERR